VVALNGHSAAVASSRRTRGYQWQAGCPHYPADHAPGLISNVEIVGTL